MFTKRPAGIAAIAAVAAVGLIGLASPAEAVVINNTLYCSAGANPATNFDTAAPVNLALTDVKMTIGATTYNSSNCYGGFAPANNGTDTATADINDIYRGGVSNPEFVYLDRTDEASDATGLGGITFTITSSSGGSTDGTFTVTWTDHTGGSDLPITVDLVILLKAGPQAAAYLFDDLLIPVSPTTASGSFDIQFKNPQNGNENGLSHIFMAGRFGTPRLVPEPATLALLGGGLLGLALARRRK